MAQLRSIDTYPYEGDRGVAMTHATGVAVCEAFSQALREQQVTTRLPGVRVFLMGAEAPTDGNVYVEVLDHKEGFEQARATLPPGLGLLSPRERALLVLEILCATTTRLAELRGWSPAIVGAARARTMEQHLTFTWASPWKVSRDRRHEARARYGIDDDGAGYATIEIRRTGEIEPFTWSAPAQAFHTVEGFRRSAATLRWATSHRVELVPFAGLFGERGETSAHTVDDPPGEVTPPVRASALPSEGARHPVVVLVTKDSTHHEIVPYGGGPTNEVPRTWQIELDRLWDELRSPEWAQWWTPAGVSTLELWWDAGAAENRVVVRRGKNKLIARIEHRPGSITVDEGAEVARRDMEALIDAVRRRERLGQPPEFSAAVQRTRRVR